MHGNIAEGRHSMACNVEVVFPAESRAKAEAALTVSMDLKKPDQQQVQDIHTCR